jgi:hypothetical protein
MVTRDSRTSYPTRPPHQNRGQDSSQASRAPRNVKKVELELMNGTIKKEIDEVGLVVEDSNLLKREEPVKVYREGADSYAHVTA